MWGIFFGEFQCLPVNDCLAVSCDSSVLERGSESMSFYSTILNPEAMNIFTVAYNDIIFIFLCVLPRFRLGRGCPTTEEYFMCGFFKGLG